MLIHHQDHVLLARSPQFLPGMVSVLAGFVEPGETLEQAVAREVYEEVGIRIKRPQYVASQPWPFPGSLMLGFVAETETTDLVPDNDEIEFAMWVHRDDVPPHINCTLPSGKLVRATHIEIKALGPNFGRARSFLAGSTLFTGKRFG
jgi:NADH pyrophosphatase NudC (nudix superfamily)